MAQYNKEHKYISFSKRLRLCVTKLNNNINYSCNPTPSNIETTENFKTEPIEKSPSVMSDESPLYYPNGPKIHLVEVLQKAENAYSSYQYSTKRPIVITRKPIVLEKKFQQLSREHKIEIENQRPRSQANRLYHPKRKSIFYTLRISNKQCEKKSPNRGRIYKGNCSYSPSTPPPVYIHNIKLSLA